MSISDYQKHILYLSRRDVEAVNLELTRVLPLVESSFVEKAKGTSLMEPKHWYESPDGNFFSAMSAYTPAFNVAGVKWQSGYPRNAIKNLPSLNGYIIINELENGLPIAIMDSTWLTAVRTGIQTGVTAKFLGRRDSEVFGILGCGVQGRTNLNALHLVLPKLRKVLAYDINPGNLGAYIDYVKKAGLEAVPCRSPKEAIADADVIVTAGPIHQKPASDINPSWLKRGVLAVPLDYDSYWDSEAMRGFDKFVVDDRGQVEHYQELGAYFLEIPKINADLAEVIAGLKPGRSNDAEKIMCMNLGVAIEDTPIAFEIYREAKEKGIGTWLPR